jgi:hypothetical protein
MTFVGIALMVLSGAAVAFLLVWGLGRLRSRIGLWAVVACCTCAAMLFGLVGWILGDQLLVAALGWFSTP